MKQLVVIGASGHGKVVADIARKNGYDTIIFLDDNVSLSECGGYQVVGKVSQFADYDCDMIVAIGNASVRKRIQQQLEGENKRVVSLIHPNAVIGENVKIGKGTVVMAGAVVNPSTSIGNGCIINTCSSVDHDNVIGDYAHISVGAHLAGSVVVGEATWVGAGATVINNISIADNCMIGAGAVVVKNITEKGIYKGVPAVKD